MLDTIGSSAGKAVSRSMSQMGDALIKLLPIVLAGAFVPTWTSHVILLLATRKPVANGVAFVLGNVTFRLILGAAVLFAAQGPLLDGLENRPEGSNSTLLLATAALLLAFAVWLWTRPPHAEERLPVWMRALEAVKPWMAFLYGFLSVAAPGIQYVYFASGLTVISGVGNTAEMLVLLVVFVVLLQVMLLAPVLLFIWRRERAERSLNAFKSWLGRNGQRASAALLGVFGVAALVLGIIELG